MQQEETIGFIGLGIMGKPMARNLKRAGYPLVLHTRTASSAQVLLAEGAVWAKSPKEVARHSDIIILMLTDSEAVAQVTLGPEGVFEGARPGSLLIDMGTTSPRLARQLATAGESRGIAVLDAPVSGGQIGAENATLSIMVGGSQQAFERALPILRVMGPNVIHVGEAGAGQITKACNQVIVGLTIEAVAEAMALASKAGVEPARVRQALLGGFAASRVLELHGQRMIEGNFKPGGRVRTHHKDLSIAIELAEEYGATVPVTRKVDDLFQELMRQGHGDDDHSALYRLFTG